MSLMPPIKSTMSERCALRAISISLNREIISPCSRYVKKGLVYIIIINPFSRQPFSCTECTKLNTCALCNMRSVSLNKCIFFTYFTSL